jgi:hypothetical protein
MANQWVKEVAKKAAETASNQIKALNLSKQSAIPFQLTS